MSFPRSLSSTPIGERESTVSASEDLGDTPHRYAHSGPRIIHRPGGDRSAACNRAATEVACGLGVEVNDLFEVVTRRDAAEFLGADGVHFTKAGYRLLAGAVADAVRRALGA